MIYLNNLLIFDDNKLIEYRIKKFDYDINNASTWDELYSPSSWAYMKHNNREKKLGKVINI